MLSRFNALPYLKVCEPTPKKYVTNQQLMAIGIVSSQTDSLAGSYKLQMADPKPKNFCCKFLSFEVCTNHLNQICLIWQYFNSHKSLIFFGVVSCTDFLLRNMMDFLSIWYVNIEFIFPFFWKSPMIFIFYSVKIWLAVHYSVKCTASWLVHIGK